MDRRAGHRRRGRFVARADFGSSLAGTPAAPGRHDGARRRSQPARAPQRPPTRRHRPHRRALERTPLRHRGPPPGWRALPDDDRHPRRPELLRQPLPRHRRHRPRDGARRPRSPHPARDRVPDRSPRERHPRCRRLALLRRRACPRGRSPGAAGRRGAPPLPAARDGANLQPHRRRDRVGRHAPRVAAILDGDRRCVGHRGGRAALGHPGDSRAAES